MSDRILGAVCMVAAAGMAWAAKDYAAPISYEPVGPRAFPLLLAALMAAGGAWLFAKPGAGSVTFGTAPWKLVGLSAIAVVLYAALFQALGFIVATALMALPLARAFGGRWRQGLLGGLGLGIGLFYVFDKLLDVVLPTGVLAFVLGGH
jgi:putative tricarboxylic transport membrane protein